MSGYEHHIGLIYCRRGRRGKCDKRLIIIVASTSYDRLARHSGLCFHPLPTWLFKKYYTYKVHVFTLLLVEVWFIYRDKCRPFLNKTLICPIKSNCSRKSMSSGECSIIKFAKMVRLDSKIFNCLLFLQFYLICMFGYGFLSGLHFGWIRFYVNACFQKVRL